MTAKTFHPLLVLIASASNNELAKYVEFLKEENKILRARIPGQVHTKPDERSRRIKLGNALGQAIEEQITLVAPSTLYRWCREADSGKKKPNPKGGQRKSREIREFVIEIAKTRGLRRREALPILPSIEIVITSFRDDGCGDFPF